MISDNLKEKYGPTKDVIYNLLFNIYSYRRKMERFPEIFKTGSRYIMIQEMAALRALFYCIVLQLCILDDESSNFSFQKIKNDINKASMSQKDKNKMINKINEYREVLTESKLKTNHRNIYIAHMNNDFIPDVTKLPDYESGLKIITQKMLDTFGEIWGNDHMFTLKVGSQEISIDLIEESKKILTTGST